MFYKLGKKFIIISGILLCSCNKGEIIMEFSTPDKNHSSLNYNIFSNNKFEISVNDSLYDYGYIKLQGDTIFMTSNVNPLYTSQRNYTFVLKKDSICRIEIEYHIEKSLNGKRILNNTSGFEMKERGCFLLIQ